MENRAGANGIIGMGLLAKVAPDGCTMLMFTGALTANAAMYGGAGVSHSMLCDC